MINIERKCHQENHKGILKIKDVNVLKKRFKKFISCYVSLVLVALLVLSPASAVAGATSEDVRETDAIEALEMELFESDEISYDTDVIDNLEVDQVEDDADSADDLEAAQVEDDADLETETDLVNEDGREAAELISEDDEEIMIVSQSFAPASIGPIISTPFDDYTLSPGEVKDWVVSVSNLQVNPQMDIVYLVDRTATMGVHTARTADALAQFTEDLVAAGAADIHFGVARFGGTSGFNANLYEMRLPLGAHDVPTVQNTIRTLPAMSGHGATEDVAFAYMRAIHDTNWRPGAQRIVIVVSDAATFWRPAVTVGGHSVTLDGVAAITAENNITPVLMGAGLQANRITRLSDMAGALGIAAPIPRFDTVAELETLLSASVIPPVATLNDYYVEARVVSITYASDGAASNDVSVTVAPNSFVIPGGQVREFDFTATAVTTPDRFNDTTIVEIGFYVDGVRIGLTTQYLEFGVDEQPQPLLHTVTFDLHGGAGDFPAQSVEDGYLATAPLAIPTRTGYTFMGWFTTATGNEEFDFVTAITEDVVVHAQWEREVVIHTVTFDLHGGAGDFPAQNVEDGGLAVAPTATPTRSGYRFIGWFTTATGDDAFNFATPITEDAIVHAQWARIVVAPVPRPKPDPGTRPPQNNNNNNLPQTGAIVGTSALVGLALATTGTVMASKKKKNK